MKIYRTNKTFKVLAVYLAMSIIFPESVIHSSFALTDGPSQPEFNTFTPISTSDMVNLSTGDFNYNIPIMDVGGYPINLSYDSGITTDREASWVGLGWNLNVGQIKRNVRGLPDDFDGDKMLYENNFKTNNTIGVYFGVGKSIFGLNELGLNLGLGVEYNDYEGYSASPSVGLSFQIEKLGSLGFDFSGSLKDGPTVSTSASIKGLIKGAKNNTLALSAGLSMNSRKSLENYSLGLSPVLTQESKKKVSGGSIGGHLSFNDSFLHTPFSNVATISENFTYSAAIGPTFAGISGQFKVSGYGSSQSIDPKEKSKKVAAFGYENTQNNEKDNEGILDFVRENDGDFSHNSVLLPLTNYTYDTYSINAQGISGQFRPHRSQIGFVNDMKTTNKGAGTNFGVEVEGGWVFAVGVDYKQIKTHSHTGIWNQTNGNRAYDNLKETKNKSIDFEDVYFKNTGELAVDDEIGKDGLYSSKIGASSPVNLALSGSKYNRRLNSIYQTKKNESLPFNTTLKRKNRQLRNQSIQKILVKEAKFFNSNFYKVNNYAKDNHTAGFNVVKPDGTQYIFGQAAYNTLKREVTFAVNNLGNCKTGLVTYDSTKENSIANTSGVDNFFNRITTPAYAHSYLLNHILSSDYVDRKDDGPTIDDYGSYTKFNYSQPYNYNWRVPYEKNTATYNKGLYSKNDDQKGNYIFGSRQQVYIKSIETKTHIAIFEMSDRKDGYAVNGENGGRSNTVTLKKIDRIKLYSIVDYKKNKEEATPIKTAHFIYDYSQCKGIPNNNNLGNLGGKLTLKKVFFTYQNSKMGAYMPYEFNYGQLDTDNDGVFDVVSNPNYNIKAYDIWGNYKENKGDCSVDSFPTTAEFPYTNQTDKKEVDKNAVSWTLTTIKLPSGGTMQIHYESDDYQFVQNKKVMQLYEVAGVGSYETPSSSQVNNNVLYNQWDEKYLYIKIPENQSTHDKYKFIEGLEREPIFFNFLLNMTNKTEMYDFVSGYLFLDKNKKYSELVNEFTIQGQKYISLPMHFTPIDGRNKDRKINPVSKAGMYFGRKKLNRIVYGSDQKSTSNDFIKILNELVGSIGTLFEIGKAPNKTLRDKGCARFFKPNKSWVRLMNPSQKKLGGGLRVKKIQMSDNWDIMTGRPDQSIYKKFYGQIYSYLKKDGTSSGVASFEPNGSKENPLVTPISNKESESERDKILAPKDLNYVEKPIGKSFYPSPSITYSRVTVQNLPHQNISKHATGKVVTEFYTSYDFPTKTSYTELDKKNMMYDKASNIASFLNFSVKNHVTASQGYVIETNDMDGKIKSTWVYPENKDIPISGIEYQYSVDNKGLLDNKVNVIDKDGNFKEKLIGLNYDVTNDFRENFLGTTIFGINTNVSGFLAIFFPVVIPLPLPSYNKQETILRTSVTTKVIHKKGLLKKKIAYDVGAKISTSNLAWDANTGEVLITQTENEFENNSYYNISLPSYWAYKGMGMATKNIDITGVLKPTIGNRFSVNKKEQSVLASQFLIPGDELLISIKDKNGISHQKVWVLDVDSTILLMDSEGKILNDCPESRIKEDVYFKVMRSGYRNIQKASMANVTTKKNPLLFNNITQVLQNNDRIINASAIEYSDFWNPINENGNKYFKVYSLGIDKTTELLTYDKYDINPYKSNIRGNWRAKKSWAYLTGRARSSNVNLKNDGSFTSFTPFYVFNNGKWKVNENAINIKNKNKWTFASEVTKFSPKGVEIENRDALNRFSSAQYGYHYTLPIAVASNSKYKEIGFDGFEDERNTPNPHFKFNVLNSKNNSTGITNSESHTGRRSLKILPGNKVVMYHNLIDTDTNIEIKDCNKDEGGGGGDGPPELVFSDFHTTITVDCKIKLSFNIKGRAGTEVPYSVNNKLYRSVIGSSGVISVERFISVILPPDCNNNSQFITPIRVKLIYNADEVFNRTIDIDCFTCLQ